MPYTLIKDNFLWLGLQKGVGWIKFSIFVIINQTAETQRRGKILRFGGIADKNEDNF